MPDLPQRTLGIRILVVLLFLVSCQNRMNLFLA